MKGDTGTDKNSLSRQRKIGMRRERTINITNDNDEIGGIIGENRKKYLCI